MALVNGGTAQCAAARTRGRIRNAWTTGQPRIKTTLGLPILAWCFRRERMYRRPGPPRSVLPISNAKLAADVQNAR
jgi:hypothetical protein